MPRDEVQCWSEQVDVGLGCRAEVYPKKSEEDAFGWTVRLVYPFAVPIGGNSESMSWSVAMR